MSFNYQRKDWEYCLFQDVFDIQGGSQPPKSNFIYEPKDGYIRLLQIRDFGEKPEPTYVPKDKVSKFCNDDDIFIARYGASLGRIVTGMSGAYNVALAKIIHQYRGVYENRFVFFMLQTTILQTPLKMISRSAQSGFAKSDLSKIKLPVVSVSEQRAIVSKIETLFSDLDNGIADLKKAQEQLKIYRQAVLKKAFEGELTKAWREKQTNLPTADELLEQIKEERQKYYKHQIEDWKQAVKYWEENGKEGKKPVKPKLIYECMPIIKEQVQSLPNLPSGWKYIYPEQVASLEKHSIGIGPFGSNLKVSDYTNSGVPLIFVRNITNNNYSLNVKYTSIEKYKELIAHSVKPLDILITKMGDPPGDCSIYPDNSPVGIITSDCLKFRVWQEFSNRMFFKYCIESVLIKKQLGLITQGVAQKKISAERFKTLLFPLTSLKEQKHIIKEIESRLSVCDKVEQNISEALDKSEALRQSILKKAFEGKLLSEAEIEKCKQEADYEPASVLLERIKLKEV